MLVRETRRGGTRGSEYAYVLIGDELVHVSKVGRLVRRDGVERVYELRSGTSPWVFIFSFRRSGYGGVAKCPPGDYVNAADYAKCMGKTVKDAVGDWLGGVSFRIESPELRGLLRELLGEFAVMASEARRYWGSVGGGLRFIGHASRLTEFFSDPRIYYFAELSMPSDSSRARGIKTTMSLIYENWVAAKIAEALGARRLARRSWEEGGVFAKEPVTVWFEQGGGTSFAVLDTPRGEFTMWLEFQTHPAIHVFPNPESIMVGGNIVIPSGHERRAVRPDIVIVKGKFDDVDGWIKSGWGIDALVECKTLPYEYWKDDVEEQVMPYVEQFRPRKAILIARRSVPSSVREGLRSDGVEVIDDVRPGGAGNARLASVIEA